MSSYGEDYSDEEQNFIEHGGASQGESDIEGGGGGVGGDNGEGSAATSGDGGSGAVDKSDGDTHGVSGSEGIGGVEDNRGANEANGSGWYVRQNAVGDWNEGDVQTSSSSWATGGNSSGNIREGEVAVRSQFPLVDSPIPVSSLTPKEFCERLKLFRSPDVTLIVGPEETVFTLPKDLLCQHSTFFDRAFNGKFKEGVDLTMRLPEDTVAAFQMMIQWI
ncbi:hypothetical protein BKA61DRAFT_678225 [Leptodontidium sp. MPI-SDFR-AT-0119]|nr:hypothetical protein BKA61DRAFT_678225 [Leptodontidium sp. MPI-SDFR-AT-0119]